MSHFVLTDSKGKTIKFTFAIPSGSIEMRLFVVNGIGKTFTEEFEGPFAGNPTYNSVIELYIVFQVRREMMFKSDLT